MQIINRSEALRLGLTRYYTGRPCKRGHVAERWVVAGCVECKREDKEAGADKERARARKYMSERLARDPEFKARQAEKTAKWRARNIDRSRDKQREYRQRPDVAAKRKIRLARPEVQARRREMEAARPKDDAKLERKRQYMRERMVDPEMKRRKQEYDRNRRAVDPSYKLSFRLRSRLHTVLRGRARVGSAVALLGCTIEQAREHIERQFLPGMTWANWSKTGWHVDHIRPLASFDLTDPEQLAAACHFTNLQPLWAVDNIRKGARIGPTCADLCGGGS